MIQRLIAGLKKVGGSSQEFSPTAEEIADVLWMAGYLRSSVRSSKRRHGASQVSDTHPDVRDQQIVEKNEDAKPKQEEIKDRHSTERAIYPPRPGTGTSRRGSPIRVPGGRALPGGLAIARALRPLLRRALSRKNQVLDEIATADRIAEEKLWQPVFRPARERWLSLALVIDNNSSMRLWRRTVEELKTLLCGLGAFNDVRTWELDTRDAGSVTLSTGLAGSPRSPRELLEPTGRRLVVVVTDCIGQSWYGAAIKELLENWANCQPVVLVQLLPQRLWSRTGLACTSFLRVKSPWPGATSSHLEIASTTWSSPLPRNRSRLPVPITTLEPRALSVWARLVTGTDRAPAIVFYPEVVEPPSSTRHLDPEERLRAFRANASPLALRLAFLFAAAPLSLPVMRLVQQVMLPQSGQSHLAEVFLGGLFERAITGFPATAAEDIYYEFYPGVRDLLLDIGSVPDAVGVQRVLSRYVTSRFGQTLDFEAILENPEGATAISEDNLNQPFAAISAMVLKRLGGLYAEAAARLLRSDSTPIEPSAPTVAPRRPRREARQVAVIPVDLDLHIRTVRTDGKDAFEYTLNSPSGAVPFTQHSIRSKPFVREPEEYWNRLIELAEQWHDGFTDLGYPQLNHEAYEALESFGRSLYEELFPGEMRLAYRKIRDRVDTIRIVSAESYVPWELLKPFDVSEGDEGFDDDFLCLQYQLTRWLGGETLPASRVKVGQVACFAVSETAFAEVPRLRYSRQERELVGSLARDGGVLDVTPADATVQALQDLVKCGGTGILHFSVHDSPASNKPQILLEDRVFDPHHLSGAALRSQLKKDQPLVFLNVCRSARQDWSLTGLAGWSDTWVRKCGCGAFLGAEWSIREDLAYEFAETFYQQLMSGRSFGEAALEARYRVRRTAPGDPAWLAYRIYADPNAHLVLGGMPSAASRYRDASAEIREHIIDYGRYVADKTEGFVGRQWLFDLIDGFIRDQPRGYVLLYGDPGIGKTTLLAQLVRQRGYAHHFNVRTDGIQRPDTFLKNICAQLIAAYGLDYTSLPPEATQDSDYLSRLLEKAAAKSRSRGEKLVLLVDALDEADNIVTNEADANLLFLPSTLPRDVYVVVTSRRGTSPLRIDCEHKVIEIRQDEDASFGDVRALIEGRLARPGIRRYLEGQRLSEALFVDEMTAKSQGNFMYLHHVLSAIEAGAYQGRDFSTLPDGLAGYYEDHWKLIRRQDEAAWFGYKLPVLVALTVVREPVSIDLIQEFSGVKRRALVRTVLREWSQFLYSTQVEVEDDHWQKRYRIYHASFQDFVASKGEVADERVDLKASHGKIADVLWTELYPEG